MDRILNKFEDNKIREYGWEGMKISNIKGCNKFEKGKNYIFDYDLYAERMYSIDWKPKKHNKSINGKLVQEFLNEEEGLIDGKAVHTKWCREVK